MPVIQRRRHQAGVRTPPPRRDVPAPVEGVELVRLRTDVGALWMPASDGVMRPYLEQYGNWEPEQGTVLRSLLTPGARVVDVGASVGYVTRLAAGFLPDVTVDAFEPHPLFARLLELNTWEYGERVRVWPLALGSERGTVGLVVAEHNIGDARVWGASERATAVAALAPLDELITGRVDVVKIDVQGYEYEAVCGMARTLRANPAVRVVVEFWPGIVRERGSDPRSVLALYRDLGFELCLVHDANPLPATDEQIVEYAASAGANGQADLLLRRPA